MTQHEHEIDTSIGEDSKPPTHQQTANPLPLKLPKDTERRQDARDRALGR